MKTEKSAAIVTVHNVDDLSAQGKKDIANWLRRQARIIEKHADELEGRYTARYLYPAED
jgi:hypothetical protein